MDATLTRSTATYLGPSGRFSEARQSPGLAHPQHLPSDTPNLQRAQTAGYPSGPCSGRLEERTAAEPGCTWRGKPFTHSEQTVHLGGPHKHQKLKQVVSILASLPRGGLRLISLSRLCFLLSWRTLIFTMQVMLRSIRTHSACLMNVHRQFTQFVNGPCLPGHSKRFPK